MNIDIYGLLKLLPEEMLEELVAILGIRGSGKSNTAGVIMEALVERKLPIQVVDPRGEYFTLKDMFPQVAVVGQGLASRPEVVITAENAAQVAEATYVHGIPTVFDLSGIKRSERGMLLQPYFEKVWDLATRHRIPTFVFLEEAHNFIPQRGHTAVSNLFADYALEGRMHGLSMVLVSQRSAMVNKNVLGMAGISFLHKVELPQDMKVYIDKIGLPPAQVKGMVRRLKKGQVLVMQDGRPIQHTIRLRHTRHVGATPSLDNVPKPTQMSLLDLLGGANA